MIGPNIPDLESNKTGYKMGDRVYIDRTPMTGKIVGIIRDKNGRLSLLQLQLKGWPKFIKRTLRDISKYPEYDKKHYIGLWKKLYPLHKFKNCTILTEVDEVITKTEFGYDFLTMDDVRKITEMEANLKNIIYNSKNE